MSQAHQDAHPALTAAHALTPEFSARASEMDTARRLPSDLASALAKAGAFRALTPASRGGMESPPTVFMEMLETLAMANDSASWFRMIVCTAAPPAGYLAPEIVQNI